MSKVMVVSVRQLFASLPLPLWVAFLSVFLELPDGMSVCHAGASYNLQMRPLQERCAKCFWQGLLRVKIEQI